MAGCEWLEDPYQVPRERCPRSATVRISGTVPLPAVPSWVQAWQVCPQHAAVTAEFLSDLLEQEVSTCSV
jgi:hypothetical protein